MGQLWRRFRAQSTRTQWLSGAIVAVLVAGVIGVTLSSTGTRKAAVTPASRKPVVTTRVPPTTKVAPTTTRSAAPTTSSSTTSPPGPDATLTITATSTSPANYVSILVNGHQSQHVDVTLPATYEVAVPRGAAVIASAQEGSGEPGAAITCKVNLHNGTPPVTKTAVGAYAIAQCNTNPR